MAKRPVFVPSPLEGSLVQELTIDFDWHPGFAITQKHKNIDALHKGAEHKGVKPVLEISTKSKEPLGQRLSAFNLKLRFRDGKVLSVEQAFQGSKVFERGGPFIEFHEMTGREIKKDVRLKESGDLIGFNLRGVPWGLNPPTAFYDWLYIHALDQALDEEPELREQFFKYAGFSDIAFNPKKSVNCQAKSAALYVALHKAGYLRQALSGKKKYLEVINIGSASELKTRFKNERVKSCTKREGHQQELFM